MQHQSQGSVLQNEYEPKSTMRTFTGVLSSLLYMGIPVGLTEFLRPGGDTLTWQISFACVVLATLLAIFSIKGTLEE